MKSATRVTQPEKLGREATRSFTFRAIALNALFLPYTDGAALCALDGLDRVAVLYRIGSLTMRVSHNVKRASLALLAIFVLYVISYCGLSACGRHEFSQSGRIRYAFGLSVSDVSMWQPRFIRWQRFTDVRGNESSRGNFLGYFYCPMITLDRWLVHPSEQLF
jgi:hypothetical protein